MEQKVKVGVIGVGNLGQWHAKNYSRLESADLTGVYDIDSSRSKRIAAKYKTRSLGSLEEIAGNIEAASVVVPADRHFEVSSFLLEKGVHLLVEKPIAVRTDEAEKMVGQAEEKSLILQVGHVERFNPVMQFLESILEHPRFIEAHRLAPYPPHRPGQPPRGTEVSVVLDLMIHDLEVILHLVHSPVTEIHAVGIPVLSASEDIANVRLSFQNGCVANVTTSRISPESMRKIRIFQEDTYISLDYQKQAGELYRKKADKITRSKVPIDKGEPLVNELASFIDCVRSREKPVVSGRQAADALKLAAAICRQIRNHAS